MAGGGTDILPGSRAHSGRNHVMHRDATITNDLRHPKALEAFGICKGGVTSMQRRPCATGRELQDD